jgi:starch-binding outer membrane protein, SusD/RagB family
MKKIICIILLASALPMACKKEFIELDPISTVSTDVLYKTDSDFKDAVNGIYSVYQTQYQNMWLFGDMRGDDSWDELVKGHSRGYGPFHDQQR